MSYVQIVERLPADYRLPMLELVEAVEGNLREQLAVRRQDFDELRDVVRALAEAQKRTEQRVEELAEAQKRTEQRVEELAEAQKRTEQRVSRLEVAIAELAEAQKRTEQRVSRLEVAIAELAEAQKRTEQRVEELAEAQKRTEQRIEELAEAQKRTEETVAVLAAEQGRMRTDLAHLKGRSLEQQYATRASAYFGYWLRRVRVKLPQALDSRIEDQLEAHLTLDELVDLLRLDALITGQPRGRPDVPELWLALEVSAVVDHEDVQRARRRAGLLRKAGYAAIPAVAGERLTDGAKAELVVSPAVTLLDGHVLHWEETLATL
jgi:hypothetical protein